ncbi:hypothetical protein Tco_0765514 [Tanacetum coccineum]
MERNPEIWSRTYLRTDRACDAVENGIRTRKWCQVGMNGMDQWPSTYDQNPLPPIKRRMTRRPPHKRKRDVSENDGQGSASAGVNTPTMSARGGTRSGKGGKKFSVSSRDGKKDAIEVSTPSSSTVGFEMSTSFVSAGVRVTESGVRLRGGSYIKGNSPTKFSTNESSGLRTMNGNVVRSMGRGDGSRSRIYPDGIRPIGYGVSWDSINGETMLGDSIGLPRPAWPVGIAPEDVRIHDE